MDGWGIDRPGELCLSIAAFCFLLALHRRAGGARQKESKRRQERGRRGKELLDGLFAMHGVVWCGMA